MIESMLNVISKVTLLGIYLKLVSLPLVQVFHPLADHIKLKVQLGTLV